MKRRFAFLFLGLVVVGALGVSAKQLQANAPICSDYVCNINDECGGIPEITCKSCALHRCKAN